MYYLKTEGSFDAAHFLKDYNGKCGNIHGHRWRVITEIEGHKLKTDTQNRGMLIDFSDLKKELREICDSFDHKFIYERNSLKKRTIECLLEEKFKLVEVDFRPTAENFSKFVYDELKKKGIGVRRVEVYETPNNYAAYQED